LIKILIPNNINGIAIKINTIGVNNSRIPNENSANIPPVIYKLKKSPYDALMK
jgi:hypothetical protein